MNITYAKDGLIKAVESSKNILYENNNKTVEDGDKVCIYYLRYDDHKKVEWIIKGVYKRHKKPKIGEDISHKKGYQQLIIQGVIKKDVFRYYIKNVSVIDISPIDKCKENIKKKNNSIMEN